MTSSFQTSFVQTSFRCGSSTNTFDDLCALDQPQTRLTECDLDQKINDLFARIKLPDDIRDWFGRMLAAWSKDHQTGAREKSSERQRELNSLRAEQDQLLDLRLMSKVDDESFERKGAALRDQSSACKLQIAAADRGQEERSDLAVKGLNFRKVFHHIGLGRITKPSDNCSI
jgi:hypothetical protein